MFYIPFCRKFYVKFKYDVSFSYCTLQKLAISEKITKAISEKITKNENFQNRPNMTFYGLK